MNSIQELEKIADEHERIAAILRNLIAAYRSAKSHQTAKILEMKRA